MYVSQETPEQTEHRLIGVLARANWHVYDENYAFVEFALDRFPDEVDPRALALVRDDEVWSQLVPSEDAALEVFRIFRFHFEDGADNSGFVGWLATKLKQTLGTGVFVVCGQNSRNGGIFDYWGVPVSLGDEAIASLAAWRG